MESLHVQYGDDQRLLRQEFKKRAKFLFRINWFRVIFDEGHTATKWNGRSKSMYLIQIRNPFG